ncbi:MAG: fumarylacetoacetate hydrolase family protein [Bacillota bacterium]
MRVLSFKKDGEVRLGLVTGAGVVDVTAASRGAGSSTAPGNALLPGTMEELISQGKAGLDSLRALEESVASQERHGAEGSSASQGKPVIPLLREDDLTYAPVVARPEKIICIGWNYVSHIEETKSRTDLPRYPEVFSVANNALAAHKQPIKLPPTASQYDYEAELVIVIGRECSMAPEDKALDYVFGYTCGNDVSERDLQKRNTQWFMGKSLDGFAPVGPHIVTADAIPDPNNLRISMRRGEEVVQDSNTRNMIFSCARLVSYLSQYLTLRPGDLIFTGTPSGVVLGQPPEQQKWVRAGETLTVYIEGIGELTNATV